MLIINMFLVLCNLVQAFFSIREGLNKKFRMMANNVVIRIFTGHVWNRILTYCLVHTTQYRLYVSVLVGVVWNNAVTNIRIMALTDITLKNLSNNI